VAEYRAAGSTLHLSRRPNAAPQIRNLFDKTRAEVHSIGYAAFERCGKVRKAFMLKLITMSVIGWALLSGGILCAQVTNATAPAIDVYDGFETAGLSKLWSTDRFEPGAVEMQTNIFRAGHGAAKIWI
jgi:hypothetical protein